VNTSRFEAAPDEVDHWTTSSHWCAGCWHWVVDCEHVLEPLQAEQYAVEDACIQSLAYDRRVQCLEVRFKWNSVTQFRPVPLYSVREIWKARPMNVALDQLVTKNGHIRFFEVRSEGKLLVSLLRGWQMIHV
jgi:hypothetical protein